MIKGKVFYVPLDKAQTPLSGEVLVDHWWVVHPENGVAFYGGYPRSDEPAPQCNRDERTARYIQERIYPGHECHKLPAVYLQHAVNEMRRLRKEAGKQ